MPIVHAKRAYRRRVLVGAAVWVAACVIACGVVLIATHDGRALPWIGGAAAIGYYGAALSSMFPRRVTLDVGAGTIAPSWRGAIRNPTVALGAWVVPSLDTPMGVVAHVGGDGGRITIGGDAHDGHGYALRGAAVRTVDCYLPAVDFDALLAALGVARDVRPTAPRVIALVRNGQRAGGLFKMMAPWFATMIAVSVVGAVVGGSGVLVRAFGDPMATYVLGGTTAALVVAGLVWTMRRASRIKPPELELRVDDHDVVLATIGGELRARATWAAVTAVPQRYRRSNLTQPVLALTIGDHAPIAISTWASTEAWPDDATKVRRAPLWLIGAPQWTRLIATLREHRRLA